MTGSVLIREDSLVTVETEGLVGDKFLLIQGGTDRASEAAPESTLQGKEPFEIGKLLEQAQGIMNQAGTTITGLQSTMKDVSGRLDTTLDTATGTIRNVNGVVLDVRKGKGTAGLLLEDPATAADVRQSIANVPPDHREIEQYHHRSTIFLPRCRRGSWFPRLTTPWTNAKVATQNLDQTSQQINTTLKSAFGQDEYGEDAGSNLQQSSYEPQRGLGQPDRRYRSVET